MTKEVSWARYSSKLLATGFELKSEDGEPLSVCPAATWDFVDKEFGHEFDHGESTGQLRLVSMAKDPSDGMPIATYDVTRDIHELIKSDKFNGISPVIKVNEVNDNSKTFTNYTITGISFQFEGAPVCPDDFCPTEYQGGDSMGKDLETDGENKDKDTKTTETEPKVEPPKKVVKKKVVAKPAKELVDQALESTQETEDPKNEYIAKLIRQNEEYETRLKAVEADLAVREAAKRAELLKDIPEGQREFAEKLESDALLNVVNILNKQRADDKVKTDETTIVETPVVETTDETTDQKKKSEETTDDKEKDPEQEEREFFDMSDVFTVSKEKSGVY